MTVYEIDQQAFAPLLKNRPAMAEDLALTLARHGQQIQAGPAQGPHHERSVRTFLKAIQTMFHH